MANTTAEPITASSSAPLTTCWPVNCKARPVIFSDSLPKATSEPVKVTPPISAARKMVMATKAPGGVDSPSLRRWCSSPQPTSRLARPPKPLSSATISGIEVILTLSASGAPMPAPMARPIAIGTRLARKPPWALASSSTVAAAMAASMPRADTALPLRAVWVLPSILRPTTKAMAPSR